MPKKASQPKAQSRERPTKTRTTSKTPTTSKTRTTSTTSTTNRFVALLRGINVGGNNLINYDVLFVREPLTPDEVLAQLNPREGVDQAHAGEHAVYVRRLISRAAQSRLSKLVQKPVYKGLTIRNWNTTTKLLAML